MKPCFVAPFLQKAAKKTGARILLEPEYGYAGQITFKNGTRHYFKDACLDINPSGALEIARDKHYSSFFLKNLGYRTIEGDVFLSPRFAALLRSNKSTIAACDYAKKLGFPVIVKPNDLSQGIAVQSAHNLRELKSAIAAMPARSRSFLIQRKVEGGDYRIVILDGAMVCAYRREPLCVIGNGKSSIKTLLSQKQAQLESKGYETTIDMHDTRMLAKLTRQKLTLASVPERGIAVTLLDNANLSTGGSASDVTHNIHPSYQKLAARITQDMGLRLCGVDIMTTDDISKPCKDYRVLEINASPGLDHYAMLGAAQKKRVEAMYLDIMRALAQ